jgi:hypothetical protein
MVDGLLFRPVVSSDEHIAVLTPAERFDSLHRKDDFFDDGVAAIFRVKAEAELQALLFRVDRFTPHQATYWLRERRIEFIRFIEANTHRPG